MLPVCTGCGQYVRVADVACPFCGVQLRRAEPGSRLPTPASMALGLSLVALNACFVGVAKYGVAPMDDTVSHTGDTDADGDGFVDENAGGNDCDDGDAAIHPDADEIPGDGVDSNCDGDDDT